PTVATSVEARLLSAKKAERVAFAKTLPGPAPQALAPAERRAFVDEVRAALYAAKACSYAQGMGLLRTASEAKGWGLRLGELARIWQAGCIIRARFLSRIKDAYERDAALPNLLLDPGFVEELRSRQDGWRSVVARAARAGLPLLTTGASLGYYDSIRCARLPANLIQAQRDFFGSHTYQRLDRPGDFHTDWR
ncbi:MAG TPA: NADP-dependent phosphogluconate dehydrogenase, partial [Polyangiaceae bacterium]|nr:NADP-dependent phosphogluconate dehydrogenase [Polyangiaceae bacterium]